MDTAEQIKSCVLGWGLVFLNLQGDRLFTSELQCQIKKRDSWRKDLKK